MQTNNHLTISRADLSRPLGEIHAEIMRRPGRTGLPRVTYLDDFDTFEMIIERSNLGVSVRCRLNGLRSHQLAGLFFTPGTPISVPMLIAASAPEGVRAEDFFA